MLAALVVSASAQVVYTCDFENAAEIANWNLNPVAAAHASKLQNHWTTGAAGQAGSNGSNGLFVSNDGVHAEYNASGYEIVAFRAMTLPAGTYKLRFDWRSLGRSQNEGMYVAWMPQSQNTNSAGTAVPAWMTNANHLTCRGEGGWTSADWQFTVTAANSNGKLVFVWWESAEETPNSPSACVDNIEIINMAADPCSQVVTNMSYNSMTKAVEWSGNATTYDVRIYNQFEDSWQEFYGVTPTVNPATQKYTYPIPGLEEGQNRFFVRGVCGPDAHGAWSKLSAFTFIKGLRCLDYFDIGTTRTTNIMAGTFANAGLCYTNTAAGYHAGQQGTLGIENGINGGPGDASNQNTTHAIHTDPYEIDPHTTLNGGLHTVAPGEIASVRLGAYNSSGQSGSVEYKYKVQAGMSDLLVLKYAVVLYSGGHPTDENPRFKLDILDGNGQQFASSCSRFLFMCGDELLTPNSGWQKEGDYYWKNWDTVTVSLREYVGQTITIRLTSIRCLCCDTHFATAYYAIGCESGDIQGLSCGDFSTDHFTAPDGFDYEWYAEANRGAVLGTDQIFNIDVLDTASYVVKCKSKSDPTCYFELVANPNPRLPFTEVTYEQHPAECQNWIDLTNTSYVGIVNRETLEPMGKDTTTQLDWVRFDWGDGSEPLYTLDSLVRHAYPAEGGTYYLKLAASMSDSICVDTITYELVLPNLTTATKVTNINKCLSDTYTNKDNQRVTYEDGVEQTEGLNTYYQYNDTIRDINQYGCDALSINVVNFHSEFRNATAHDTICQGEKFVWGKNTYTTSGLLEDTLVSSFGCDSILPLQLFVAPKLYGDVPHIPYICASDAKMYIDYSVIPALRDELVSVTITPDQAAQAAGFLPKYTFPAGQDIVITLPGEENMTPGNYTFGFDFNSRYDCQRSTLIMPVEVRYGLSAVDEIYGYVFATDTATNGGHQFVHYQWFVNGELQQGDTLSYIEVADKHVGDVYYCLMTALDGQVYSSCPIVYDWTDEVPSTPDHNDPRTPLDDQQTTLFCYPTALAPGAPMMIYSTADFAIYDVVGRLVDSYKGSSMMQTVAAPSGAGMYIIKSKDANDVTRILVQ